jgi:hypothetical protein
MNASVQVAIFDKGSRIASTKQADAPGQDIFHHV